MQLLTGLPVCGAAELVPVHCPQPNLALLLQAHICRDSAGAPRDAEGCAQVI